MLSLVFLLITIYIYIFFLQPLKNINIDFNSTMYDKCTCTEGLLYSGGLVVLANFECHLAVTVVFMRQFTVKKSLHGCGKL